MRTIFIIVRKEFLQIFRNRSMLPIIFIMPVVQLLVLANAASFEIEHLKVHVQDFDHTSTSRALIQKFAASPYFDFVKYTSNETAATEDFLKDKADLIVRIPHGFEKDLVKEQKADVQLVINAINGSAAAVSNGYATSILQDFNKNIAAQWINKLNCAPVKTIETKVSYWFNPEMNYQTFMVPGILVLLVTMIGMFLAGMNIVREKEIGTIEQLNVTPIKKYQFITGKLLPFWILALFELAFGLLIGKLVFDIPIVGSIFLIFFFAAIYLMVILGMGLFVSTITETQQQAMFIAWFFMVIFILMSGLFTPIESMPGWAQAITRFNPVAYFVAVMRMVMLKGAHFADIRLHLAVMVFSAFLLLGLATWRYRKVAG